MFRLVFRQLQLDLFRTALTGGAIAAVVAVILVLEGFYAGLIVQLRDVVMSRNADLIVVQSGVSNMVAVRSVLPQFSRQDVEAVQGVDAVHPLSGIALIYEQGNNRTPISLFVYDTTGGPTKLAAGRQITMDREIVIDRSLAEKYDLSPGDAFIISDFEFRIAGIADGAAAFLTPFGFIRFDDLIDFYFESDLAEDISTFPLLSFLLVELQQGAQPRVVAERIETAVPSADVFLPEVLADHDADLGRITLGPILGLLIGVGYIVGLLVTAIIMFASVNNRRHDFGVLKALGFSNQFLVGVVLVEALVLTSLAIPLGVLLATVIGVVIENTAPLYLIMAAELVPVIRTSIACLVFAVVGSLLPVKLIYKVDPGLVFRS